MRAPQALRDATDWIWRGLLVLLAAWVLLQLCLRLVLVVVPFIVGLLLSALVHPGVAWLRRRGLSRGLTTLVVAVVALAVVGGLGSWIGLRFSEQAPEVIDGFADAIRKLPVRPGLLSNLQTQLLGWLQGRSDLVGGVVSTLRVAAEVGAGALLAVFVATYLVYDGAGIWRWLVDLLPPGRRPLVDQVGADMWVRLGGWIRGTALIALFHAVVVGTTLALMRVPLVLSLALLVFVGSFIPLVGSYVFGGFATLVTFASQGLVPALVLVGVLVVSNQAEAHLLQPFLVGRYVRLHPLAVVAAVATGGVLAGLGGAVLAVPVTAAAYAAVARLSRSARSGDDEPAEAAEP